MSVKVTHCKEYSSDMSMLAVCLTLNTNTIEPAVTSSISELLSYFESMWVTPSGMSIWLLHCLIYSLVCVTKHSSSMIQNSPSLNLPASGSWQMLMLSTWLKFEIRKGHLSDEIQEALRLDWQIVRPKFRSNSSSWPSKVEIRSKESMDWSCFKYLTPILYSLFTTVVSDVAYTNSANSYFSSLRLTNALNI